MEQMMIKQREITIKSTKSKVTKRASKTAPSANTKLRQLEAMLRRPEGATILQLAKVLDWQTHSIRGAMSGSLKKKQGLAIIGSKAKGEDRVYRIAS
jgi:hypothetical protein